MNQQLLRKIIFDQKEVFLSKDKLIARDLPLDNYISTSQIVVITGVRRCGKSSLLNLIMKKMELTDAEFLYFNFDDERIINYDTILEDIDALHKEVYEKEPILFFDEIQNIKGWEKYINRQYEKGRKIFVTGSNARLLSSEISTSLTGRNKTIELFPFSFREFLRFESISYDLNKMTSNMEISIKSKLNTYFDFGGFPIVLKERDLELLDGYFKDILYRDIIARYGITQIEEIKHIGLYFFSNSSKLFSYATLQKITGIKSSSSVKQYLDYYQSSYLFYYLRKFDYSIKKQILNPRKVYTIDVGLSQRIGFNFSKNDGRFLENIVFLELLRRRKEVFYYVGKGECDFVIKKGLQIIEAIQVVYTLDISNLDREVNGLKEAMIKFELSKGLIIVHDTKILTKQLPDGISIISIWEYLLVESW